MVNKIKISAGLVKKLREETGSSVMDCRNALEKGNGNFEKALIYLRKKGIASAEKKTGRKTSEGIIASYIHSNNKIGALIQIFCETDFVARNSDFQELAHDLAMQIAAMNPHYLSIKDVPEKDKNEYEHLVRDDLALKDKPADIIEKIVDGKVEKHFKELSLLSQSFVKNADITIEEMIKEKISRIGENIQIGKFVRFEI